MPNRSGSLSPVPLRSFSRAFPRFLTTVVLTVAGLVLLSILAFEIQGSVRAYIHGEGEWSKAQRDAVACLLRYAQAGEPDALACYREAIAVNLSDRAARLELEKPQPDFAVARERFLGGRNHPEDVDRMVRLFRAFRREPHMSRAIAIWSQADEEILRLEAVVPVIEQAHAAGTGAQRMQQLLAQVNAINARLTPLEREFSGTLNSASRLIDRWLVVGIVAIGAVFIWIGGTIVHRLLTHLNRSQGALMESQRELSAILETALDAVIAMDHEGSVRAFNAAAEQMFETKREEVLGKEMITVIAPPELWDAHRRGLERYLESGEARVLNRRLELTAIRPGGKRFPIELTITRVPGTTPPRFTGFLRDLTARREAEERLAQAQKLETVGRLAGGVAHDFNNVLTAILGFSDLLRERLEVEGGSVYEINQIQTAAERARSLTAQLLAFSRKQMLTLEALGLNELVHESAGLLERLIGESVRVQLDLDPNELPIRADRGQLQQVVLNLAVNARDAMPDGGRLTIATRAADRVMRLTVSDTGAGMPPEVQARIFEPFFTTKGQGRGTGLGLATAYGTISQLGGTITVDSILNVGTRFTIELPATAEAPKTKPSQARRPEAAPSGTRILVVEDEAAVRTLVSQALRKRGHEVHVAASAEDALAMLDMSGLEIDLLLSDVVMPGMNGHTLAKKLRAERPYLKVILMSGYSEEQVRSQTSDDGFLLLLKPFAVSRLEETVSEMFESPARTLVPAD